MAAPAPTLPVAAAATAATGMKSRRFMAPGTASVASSVGESSLPGSLGVDTGDLRGAGRGRGVGGAAPGPGAGQSCGRMGAAKVERPARVGSASPWGEDRLAVAVDQQQVVEDGLDGLDIEGGRDVG